MRATCNSTECVPVFTTRCVFGPIVRKQTVHAFTGIVRLRPLDAFADARHRVFEAPFAERLQQIIQRALFKRLHGVLIVRRDEDHDRPFASGPPPATLRSRPSRASARPERRAAGLSCRIASTAAGPLPHSPTISTSASGRRNARRRRRASGSSSTIKVRIRIASPASRSTPPRPDRRPRAVRTCTAGRTAAVARVCS